MRHLYLPLSSGVGVGMLKILQSQKQIIVD